MVYIDYFIQTLYKLRVSASPFCYLWEVAFEKELRRFNTMKDLIFLIKSYESRGERSRRELHHWPDQGLKSLLLLVKVFLHTQGYLQVIIKVSYQSSFCDSSVTAKIR